MADVIVTLSLTRKSGILAAAVSSLARNGLEFQSHRFVEPEDADGLHVELMAEGEVEDKGALTEVLERIRGVDAVTDIGVDGRSLLHDEPADDEEAEVAPESDPAEAVAEAPAEVAPEPEPERLPERGVAANENVEEDEDEESEGDSGPDGSRSERTDSSGKNPARRPMLRRRRRFT